MASSVYVGSRSLPRTFLVGLALAALLACSGAEDTPPRSVDPASARSTLQGEVLGFVSEDGAHVWRGIPFAKPPVGPRRWRAPDPPDSRSGPLEALQHGPSCAQLAGPGGGPEAEEAGGPMGSEDCLYLDIYAPRFARDEVPGGDARLPVMFWIHGGGNSVGDARLYDGSRLAVRNDVIVVTVQYRLGIFGWLTHRALRKAGASPADRSGNYGTLDLVSGLEWVQRNIAAFGGDPGRVTVFGESAGATNVMSLLLSPRASGLFHRAISQSGGAWTYSMDEAEGFIDDPVPGHPSSSNEILLRLLEGDGLASSRSAAKAKLIQMSDDEVAYYLRRKSTGGLLAAFDGEGFAGMYRMPALLRDGDVLPKAAPNDVFSRSGAYNAVPTILGTNRDEDKLFLLFTASSVTRLFGLPLWVNDPDLYDATAQYQSAMWRVTGVNEPARAMRVAQGPSVFAYRFDWDDEPKLLWTDFSKLLGAAHVMEVPFVFGYTSLGLATPLVFSEEMRESNEALSADIMSYWAQFAYEGAPGRGRDGRLPLWEPWGGEDPTEAHYMLLDSEADAGLRMASQGMTRNDVLQGVASDPRFPSWRERCAVYASFVKWSERMKVEEYEAVGDGACRIYPLGEDA